ncbi:MAG: dihydroorotate dehydrogenase electron transfer subunit [Nitrospira bacterium HGW-Nitrospira-1]|nr:MAG: dihydroorotate dehydrogenase electron transfer subunit [Nitrospira bacterium HGW-Nitrospira-1]
MEPFPGQFYMVKAGRGNDPLLRRAFSLFRRTSEGFQVMYRIKGRGTSLLREMKTEDTLEVLGPLGNGYPFPSDEQTPLVVAGGIGIASVFPFLHAHQGRAFVFYGARSGDEIFMLDELRGMGREIYISTDDGSLGTKGSIVDVLNNYLDSSRTDISRFILYACGPHPMLKAVSKVAASRGITAYISMEANMACGLGACLGCVVKTKTGYKRVCKEGPVFKSEEIVW